MNCAFSKTLLALHVGGDLPDTDERMVAGHLNQCATCRNFLEQLTVRQSQMRSLRQETIPHSALTAMRQEVLSRIDAAPDALGWRLRLERLFMLGFRQHVTPRLAIVASLTIIAIVSATLFAQRRQAPAKTTTAAAMFAAGDTLLRPDGYRQWVSIGSEDASGPSMNPHVPPGPASDFVRKVYIDQLAYREFATTGKFPEGAVLVMELAGSPGQPPFALEASVKDRRFAGGWGFFDFTEPGGRIQDKARVILDKHNCRTCHEERARTDHVFTQFHPILNQLL